MTFIQVNLNPENDFINPNLKFGFALLLNTAMNLRITHSMRQIQYTYINNKAHLTCYVDGIVSEYDISRLEAIQFELEALWLPDKIEITNEIIRLDYPNPIPKVDLKIGGYAYARKEKLKTYNYIDEINLLTEKAEN